MRAESNLVEDQSGPLLKKETAAAALPFPVRRREKSGGSGNLRPPAQVAHALDQEREEKNDSRKRTKDSSPSRNRPIEPLSISWTKPSSRKT